MTRPATGNPAGRPSKTPETRSELRGRGRAQVIRVAPAADLHGQLIKIVAAGDLPAALTAAARDALWLRPADAPALVLAQLIARELVGAPHEPQDAAPPMAKHDPVGTLPAFPEADGGAALRSGSEPDRRPPLRELAPLLVGLLSDLGMHPQARARLGITLVEEPEIREPGPRRLPVASR